MDHSFKSDSCKQSSGTVKTVFFCEAGSVSFSAKRGLRIHVIFPHVNGGKICYAHLDLYKSSNAVPRQSQPKEILRTPPWKCERGSRFHCIFFSSCCCGFPVLVSEIPHSAKEISALQKFSPVVDTCHCLISISGIPSMLRSGCFSHLPESFYHSPSKWLRRLSCQASLGDLQNPKHQCSEWSLNLRCLHL